MGENICTMKRNTQTLLHYVNVVGLEVMAEKSKCMWTALH
jgi:hypothetical protein